MEIEPFQIIFDQYEDNEKRIEKMYIKNSDPELKDMHVEFKLFDTKKIRLSPQCFVLAPNEIKEIIIELIPCEITSRLELQDFMFVTANQGEFEKRISIHINHKSLQRFDTNSSRYQLEPDVHKTSLRNSQLQERALHQILEEKDRLIQRLEDKIQRNDSYYSKIEHILRNNSNYNEIQILLNQIKERDQREIDYREKQFQNAIKQKDLLLKQQDGDLQSLRDNLFILNQQNSELKERLRIFQTQDIQSQFLSNKQIQSIEEALDKQRFKYEEKIQNYRSEIESLKGIINAEKKKSQQIILQTELLQNDKDYIQQQFQEAEQRYYQAKNEAETLLEKLHQAKLANATNERNRIQSLENEIEQLRQNQLNIYSEEAKLIQQYKKQNEDLTKKYNHLQKLLEENEKQKLEDLKKQQDAHQQELQEKIEKQKQEQKEPEQNLQPIVQDIESNRYKMKYEAKKQKYKNVKTEMKNMYEELKQMTQENIDSNQKINSLNEQIQQQNYSLQQANQQLHALQSSNKDNVNSRIAMIEKIKDRFEDQLKQSQQKYQEELQLQVDQIQNLKVEIERKTRDVQKLSNTIQEKEEDIVSLKTQIQDQKEKQKKSSKSAQPKEDLGQTVKSLNQALSQKDSKIEELQKELKEIKSERDEIEKTAKKKHQTFEKKIQEIETQKKQFEDQIFNESDKSTILFESTLKQLRIENKELERKYFEEIENYKIIQSQFCEKEMLYKNEIDDLQRKIQELKHLNSSDVTYDNINQQKVSRNVQQLQEEVILAREQIRDLSLQLKDVSESAFQLEKQLNEIIQKYEESQQQVAKYKAIEDEMEQLKRRSQREQQYKEQINEELEALKKYVQEIQRQKDNISVQIKLKDEAIQEGKEYQQDLIKFMKELEQKYQELEDQTTGQSYDLNSQVSYYIQQVDLLTFENKRIHDKNQTINSDLAAQIKENKDLKSKLIQEEQKSKALEAQLSQYDKTKKKQLQTLKSQFGEQKSYNEILQQEKETLQIKIEEMHQIMIDSEQIYQAHINIVKSKFNQGYKEFIEQVNSKIKFFIAKKDQIDVKSKILKMFERYLEEIPTVSEKEAKIKSMSNKIQSLKDQLAEKQNELENLQNKTNQNLNQTNNVNNANNAVNKAVKSSNKYNLETIVEHAKIIVQKQDIEKLFTEIQQYKQLVEQKQSDIDVLNKQVHDKDEKTKQQSAFIQKSKEDLQNEKLRADKIQEEKDDIQKQIKSLQAQLKVKNNTIDQKNEEINKIAFLKQYNDQLKEDNAKKEEQIAQNEKVIKNQKDQIGKLTKQIQETERKDDYVKEMQDKYNKMKEEATQVLNDNKKYQEQISSLKNDIVRKDLLLQDKVQLEEKHIKLKQVYEKLKENNSKNKDNIKKLTATIKVKDQVNQQLKSQVFDDVDVSQESESENKSNNLIRQENQKRSPVRFKKTQSQNYSQD